jgi:hypothetical protein
LIDETKARQRRKFIALGGDLVLTAGNAAKARTSVSVIRFGRSRMPSPFRIAQFGDDLRAAAATACGETDDTTRSVARTLVRPGGCAAHIHP